MEDGEEGGGGEPGGSRGDKGDKAIYGWSCLFHWNTQSMTTMYYYASVSAWNMLFWYEVNEQVDVHIGAGISPPEKWPLTLLYTVLPTQKSSFYATIHNTICKPSQKTNKYIAKYINTTDPSAQPTPWGAQTFLYPAGRWRELWRP